MYIIVDIILQIRHEDITFPEKQNTKNNTTPQMK